MKTSAAGRAALIAREGKKLTAYQDTVGIWTIGVGHTSAAGLPKVVPGLKITAAECDEILSRDLVQYEAAVSKAVKVPLSQNEFDALVSLCFNIGATAFAKSSVVKRLNAGDRQGAADAFRLWNMAGGKPVKGLTTRREAERKQFLATNSAPKPQQHQEVSLSDTDKQSGVGLMPAATVKQDQWPEDSLVKEEIELIQARLRAKGYHTVGYVDGKWGGNTAAGLKQLQEVAGIKADGHWGPETRAALFSEGFSKPISADRAAVTAETVRASGSATVRRADKISLAAIAGIAMTAVEGAVYVAQHYQSTDLPFGTSLVFGFLPPGIAAIAPIVAQAALCGYSWWKSKGVVQARVEAERSGLHNGEPAPVSETAAQDGIFGRMFGRS